MFHNQSVNMTFQQFVHYCSRDIGWYILMGYDSQRQECEIASTFVGYNQLEVTNWKVLRATTFSILANKPSRLPLKCQESLLGSKPSIQEVGRKIWTGACLRLEEFEKKTESIRLGLSSRRAGRFMSSILCDLCQWGALHEVWEFTM